MLTPYPDLIRAVKLVPTQRPSILWRHQLAQGLIGCWLPGGAAGGVNLAGQKQVLAFGSNAKQSVTGEGPGESGDTNASNTGLSGLVNSSPFTAWTALTLYWRGLINSAGAVQQDPLVGITYDNIVTSPYVLAQIQSTTSGWSGTNNLILAWNTAGVAGSFTVTTSTITPGRFYGVAGVFPVGGTCRLYLNGVQDATTASFGASAPNSTATSTLGINHWEGVSSRFSGGICNAVYIWNRILTPTEIMALELDPYGFLIDGDSVSLLNSVAAAAAVVGVWEAQNVIYGNRTIGY